MSEDLPAPEADRVSKAVPTGDEILVLGAGTRIVRIHPLGGKHPSAWNALRDFGPTRSRFDHHLPPPRSQERKIAYLAHGDNRMTGAVAEFFQDGTGAGVRPLDLVAGDPQMTSFELARPIRLLDLDTGWITRAKGNQAVRSGRRSRSREWARAIYDHYGDKVSGLAFGSSVWGPGRNIALWESGAPALPDHPSASRPLRDPALRIPLSHIARDLATTIVDRAGRFL